WAFIEQNLAYQHLLGDHGLMGTGVQLTWTPLTPVYTRFGVEALQGDQAVVGRFDGEEAIRDLDNLDAVRLTDRYGDPKGGPRLFTAFAKLAPDLGYSHELQMGLFGVFAGEQQEVHDQPEEHLLRGDYGVVGTDWVYAYDAPHQYGKGDLKISAEYLYAVKDLEVAEHEAQPQVGDDRTFREDGFYVQGRYGFAANWRAALRYDAVGVGINEKDVGATGTAESWDATRRASAVLTWPPTHYSRLQAQWSGSDIATGSGREQVSQYFLRFIASMGQHGAHEF
ncbi:MAG: porin, partial [Thiohalorhabdaceae bacterium]